MGSTPPQTIVIDKEQFRKANLINQGTFGKVYEGKLRGTIKIAIKELFDQSVEKELSEEIQLQQKLKHENVIVIYGYCLKPLSLIMELMKQSLQDFLESNQEIP